jgi:hypothetical protein
MNGFCDNMIITNNKLEKNPTKKSVKYKSDQNSIINGEEVMTSASSSSTTSGQSPGNNSTASKETNNSSIGLMRKSSTTSKLNIARSFNITSNFSDDDECGLKTSGQSTRKKATNH